MTCSVDPAPWAYHEAAEFPPAFHCYYPLGRSCPDSLLSASHHLAAALEGILVPASGPGSCQVRGSDTSPSFPGLG